MHKMPEDNLKFTWKPEEKRLPKCTHTQVHLFSMLRVHLDRTLCNVMCRSPSQPPASSPCLWGFLLFFFVCFVFSSHLDSTGVLFSLCSKNEVSLVSNVSVLSELWEISYIIQIWFKLAGYIVMIILHIQFYILLAIFFRRNASASHKGTSHIF